MANECECCQPPWTPKRWCIGELPVSDTFTQFSEPDQTSILAILCSLITNKTIMGDLNITNIASLSLTDVTLNVTGNIAVTSALAILTYLITTFTANKNYWKHIFWMPGVPVPMKFILAPIELLGTLIKPFALTMRLYANMFAGHIVLMSIIGLIFIYKSWVGGPLSFGLAFGLSILELLVAALQAYIFTVLSALYFGSAVEEHSDH